MNNEKARLVSYEAVVANPATEFAGLCEFLEVRFEPKMAQGLFDSSIHRDPAPAIEPHIQQECEHLWQRLCQLTGNQ